VSETIQTYQVPMDGHGIAARPQMLLDLLPIIPRMPNEHARAARFSETVSGAWDLSASGPHDKRYFTYGLLQRVRLKNPKGGMADKLLNS
jgi:hypothetical protein